MNPITPTATSTRADRPPPARIRLSGLEEEEFSVDAVEGAAAAEDQAGGEVDEAFGVAVRKVRQVHEHGHALAEEVPDVQDLVVVLGTQRLDHGPSLPGTSAGSSDPRHRQEISPDCRSARPPSDAFVTRGDRHG